MFRSKADKTWSAAVGKTSPDSSMIVKSGKGVRKLNKSIKDIKGTQRDEKIRNDTKGDVTKRECTERSRY